MTGSKAHRLAAELSSDFGRNVGDTWVLRGCVGFTGGEGTLLSRVCRRLLQRRSMLREHPAAVSKGSVLALGDYKSVLCSHQRKSRGRCLRAKYEGRWMVTEERDRDRERAYTHGLTKGGPHWLSVAIPARERGTD